MIFNFKLAVILAVKNIAMLILGFSWFSWQGSLVALFLSLAHDVYYFFFCDQILVANLQAESSDYYRYNILGATGLQRFVHSLAYQMNVPTPEVLIFKEQKPLIYVLGRSSYSAKILLSSGSLQMLSHEELKAFLVVCLKRMALGGVLSKTYLACVLFGLNRLIFDANGPRFGLRFICCIVLVPYWWALSRLAAQAETDYLQCDIEAAKITGGGSLLAEALSKVDIALSYEQKKQQHFAFYQATGHLAVVNPMTRYPLFSWLHERSRMKRAKNAGFGRGLSSRTSQLLDVQRAHSGL
jgi:hypothetical protein